MKCLEVTFAELSEVEGAFGKESISPGGAVFFPKYLILSYDINSRTVVFPDGWVYHQGCMKSALEFGNHFLATFGNKAVEKTRFVEVEYDLKEFEPNNNLMLVKLYVLFGDKPATDELVQKYSRNKTIVAERSRESAVVRTVGGKKEYFPAQYYELVFDLVGNRFKFFVELGGLIPDKDSCTILADDPGVFPRQLANFK